MKRISLCLLFFTLLCGVIHAQQQSPRLFTDEQRGQIPNVFADFAERTIDRLRTIDEATARQLINQYGMTLVTDKRNMTRTPRQWTDGLVRNIESVTNLVYDNNGEELTLAWTTGSDKTYAMTVTITRETIEGTDKAEADMLTFQTMSTLPKSTYTAPVPTKSQLIKTADSDLLVHEGMSYMMESMNGSTYYKPTNNDVEAAFSAKYPVESLKNLVQGVLKHCSYRLKATFMLYGGSNQTIEMSLKDYTDYWKTNPDFDVYSGVSSTDNGFYIVHIAQHRLLRYAHVAIITFPNACFNEKTATLSATVSINIPQHNIKELF